MTMSLLATVLFGFSANSISLTRLAKTADGTSVAAALGQQKLEQLRSLPLGAVQLAPGQYADAASLRADGSEGGPFSRAWTVSAKDTPRVGLKTVTVDVTWTDSRSHTSRVAAYVRCSTVPCA